MFDPAVWISAIAFMAFLAGAFLVSRRMRTGWSPRKQQRLHRGLFYYSLVVLVFFTVLEYFTGQGNYTFFFFWGIFILSMAWQAFRTPSEPDLLKNFAANPYACGRCGYDLTGNVSGTCPECGWRVPSAPPVVEKLNWAIWWQGWQIEHLDNWRRTLASMLVLCVLFAGLAAWLASWPGTVSFFILPVLMCLHFGINAARVISYARRQRAG